MQHIEALLRKEIGLDAASIGSSLIERTVRLRMKQHAVKRDSEYEQMLRESRQELDALIEEVVVTETWFFRDQEPFNVFAQMVGRDWLPRHPEATMRILSVPCSSGEEPYSLAMALLDVGVAPDRFHVDAVDISLNALARAQRAVYGKNSFRGNDLSFRERHFVAIKEGFALNQSVRRQVSFARANVLDEGFLADSAPYDFIFCRNLLIYFDRATQIMALAKLHRLLNQDGFLFVGPAEMPLVNESGFTSAKIAQAFACRKTIAGTLVTPRPPRRAKATRFIRSPFVPAPAVNGATPPPNAVSIPAKVAANDPNPDAGTLQQARVFADSGQLAQAAAFCEAHLTRHSDCAEAYYLLGLVKDAGNDPQAINYYRKALYLDPNHYETLIHAALWLEKTGDVAGARTLKRRAERLQAKTQMTRE